MNPFSPPECRRGVRVAACALCIAAILLSGACATLRTADVAFEDLSWELLDYIPEDTEATIAVYYFLDDRQESERSDYVIDRLITGLASAIYDAERPLTVVSRTTLDRLLEEQAFRLSALADPEAGMTLGRLLGADIIVTGTITRRAEGYELNAQLIRVQNGAVLGGIVRLIPYD